MFHRYYYTLVMVASVAIGCVLLAGVVLVWFNNRGGGKGSLSEDFLRAYTNKAHRKQELAVELGLHRAD